MLKSLSAALKRKSKSKHPPPLPPPKTGKPIFFHYMIGTIHPEHCKQDILDAHSLGIDAFALNLNTCTAPWALATVSSLFHYAGRLCSGEGGRGGNFKLFFSFDMTGFTHPSEFIEFLLQYVHSDVYFRYEGLPLVSTFNGGAETFNFGCGSVDEGWRVHFKEEMERRATPVYFVPAFQDVRIEEGFWERWPSLDGAMNWDAWPFVSSGRIPVPSTTDSLLLSAAFQTTPPKSTMLTISPLQFKHLPYGNWYRRGHANLEIRLLQMLALQPDMLQFVSWNDAGEAHYMGNVWQEAIVGSGIEGYTEGLDHRGWWEVVRVFVEVWKEGRRGFENWKGEGKVVGCFWGHKMLSGAKCPNDPLGPPEGIENVEDKVTAIIILPSTHHTYFLHAILTCNDTHLGTQPLVPGYNAFSFDCITTGKIAMRVVDREGRVLSRGRGEGVVVDDAEHWNYNFWVVGLEEI